MPKVSIITRTKDRPLLLERAIKSVLSQSFDDWEHVIIDSNNDCQKEFDELILKYSNKYQNSLKIIKNIDNIPLDPSMNIGLKNADGEYLVFHDDDDDWEVDFLMKTVNFLDKNVGFGGVVTDINYYIEEILGNEIKIHQKYVSKSLNPLTISSIFLKKIYNCPISSLYRRSCIEKTGKFNENLLKSGDREFVLRFLKNYKIATLPEALANYHARPYNQQVYANSTLSNNAHQDNIFWEKKLKNELFKHNFDLWLYYHLAEFIRPHFEKKSIKAALKKCAGQKIALYGAGIRAEELLKNHKKEFKNLNICAVFDQNIQKQGKYFAGNLILAPEQISEINPDKIIITVANISMVQAFIEILIAENNLECEVVNF